MRGDYQNALILLRAIVATLLMSTPADGYAQSTCPNNFGSYESYLIALKKEQEKCPTCNLSDFCDPKFNDGGRSAYSATETYNIDLLEIRHTYSKDARCDSGFINKYELEGVIGPDSTFAMTRLLERYPPCRDASGKVTKPSVIYLNSNGGLLADGYALGRELRRLGISSVVAQGDQCASSCAVAFLGGEERFVRSNGAIMFHAPYFNGENAYGKRDISCDVGEKALAELRAYYQEMTDAETGDRLFERTMWYCSADDGWVVKGASAAELFGIATEK